MRRWMDNLYKVITLYKDITLNKGYFKDTSLFHVCLSGVFKDRSLHNVKNTP